jgi:DNA-binding transcriptional regulator GbsR (MarR family)
VILHSAPATEIAKMLLDGEATIAEIAESLQVSRTLVADVVAYLAGAQLVVARC